DVPLLLDDALPLQRALPRDQEADGVGLPVLLLDLLLLLGERALLLADDDDERVDLPLQLRDRRLELGDRGFLLRQRLPELADQPLERLDPLSRRLLLLLEGVELLEVVLDRRPDRRDLREDLFLLRAGDPAFLEPLERDAQD